MVVSACVSRAPIDELGFSRYPGGGHPPDVFREVVVRSQETVGKPAYIAEYGYPAGAVTGPWRVMGNGPSRRRGTTCGGATR